MKKIILLALVTVIGTGLFGCGGSSGNGDEPDDPVDDTGNGSVNNSSEDNDLFFAPSKFGYRLEVVPIEGDYNYTVADPENDIVNGFVRLFNPHLGIDVPIASGEIGKIIALNYFDMGFVYYGDMIEGDIYEGGICRIFSYDLETEQGKVLCTIPIDPARKTYGQVVAAAGLLFIATENHTAEVAELSVQCFDTETGERIVEWRETGDNLSFVSGCASNDGENIYFDIATGQISKLYEREGRTFKLIRTGANGWFDDTNSSWVYSKIVTPSDSFIADLEIAKVDKADIFPISLVSDGFLNYYAFNLLSKDIAPFVTVKSASGTNIGAILDADGSTYWEADNDEDIKIRVDFASPIALSSILLLYPLSVSSDAVNYVRIERINIRLSDGFSIDVELEQENTTKVFDRIPLNEYHGETSSIEFTIPVTENNINNKYAIAEIDYLIR